MVSVIELPVTFSQTAPYARPSGIAAGTLCVCRRYIEAMQSKVLRRLTPDDAKTIVSGVMRLGAGSLLVADRDGNLVNSAIRPDFETSDACGPRNCRTGFHNRDVTRGLTRPDSRPVGGAMSECSIRSGVRSSCHVRQVARPEKRARQTT